jgi:Zn-dependent M28 family amino/carboxypeptidase
VTGLREVIDREKQPRPLALPATVRVVVNARYVSAAPTANVVGLMSGRDPALADETLVIGAHLDHVGEQAGELLFPGANDNASGAAAVVALAEAFARRAEDDGDFPQRSVVFVLFAGEEQGLLGARHYVDHPVVPLSRTVAMLNLDCIASGDSLQAGGGANAPRLWELARDLDREGERLLVERTGGGGGADATPFHEAGVPTLYFATTNGYRDLHQPTDVVERLYPQLYLAMARLAVRVAAVVADGGYERETVVP